MNCVFVSADNKEVGIYQDLWFLLSFYSHTKTVYENSLEISIDLANMAAEEISCVYLMIIER